MVNSEDFIKRLEEIIEYYGLTASAFADKIGVQRSSVSHLLSGRNKPSLDFSLKIIDEFPEVDLYWLLIGKGSFPKSEQQIPTPTFSEINKNPDDLFSSAQEAVIENEAIQPENILERKIDAVNSLDLNEPIEKIVVFYKNGTFKSYSPR